MCPPPPPPHPRFNFGALPPLQAGDTPSLSFHDAQPGDAAFVGTSSAAEPGKGGGSHGTSSSAVLRNDRAVRSATVEAERRLAKRAAGVRHSKINARRKANR